MKQVIDATSLSRTHVYRLMESGDFPRSVPLGAARVAWLEEEVKAWMKARVASRE